MNILDIVTDKGLIQAPVRQEIEAEIQQGTTSAEEALFKRGLKPEDVLAALGEHYALPTRILKDEEKIDPEILAYIDEDSARHYKLLPLAIEDGVLMVGAVDPDDFSATDALNFISTKSQLPYKLVVLLERDFYKGLAMYENLSGEVGEALSQLEDDAGIALDIDDEELAEEEVDEEHIKEDAPVTKIVATIIRYAVDGGASDIHIEPVDKKVRVRFRIDGVLATSLELPEKVHSAVVARTKILSSMRLDEKRKPQDGRFSAKIDGRKIDFRVSTLPTYFGEKVVMRILDPETVIDSLDSTGLSTRNIDLLRKAIQKPYGIILVSGPTGSGKSTTLRNMLAEVDRTGKNVISLEDPVEYNIPDVNQSQVRSEIGYTFASGLRSILRQDPDVIMVGEIRDKETAQLAIQAALTGHLVFSTIHTNNAIGVVPRLVDMGVDPYLIAPTLTLAMAQRLVRRICPGTGIEAPIEGSIKAMIDAEFKTLPKAYRSVIPKSDRVLHVEKTEECPTGTKGRIAVTEVISFDTTLERLILSEASEEDMYTAVRKKGFVSMKEDALIKAMEGTIPFEEVNALGGVLLSNDVDSDAPETVDNPNIASSRDGI